MAKINFIEFVVKLSFNSNFIANFLLLKIIDLLVIIIIIIMKKEMIVMVVRIDY